jgi:hypothetical protein
MTVSIARVLNPWRSCTQLQVLGMILCNTDELQLIHTTYAQGQSRDRIF